MTKKAFMYALRHGMGSAIVHLKQTRDKAKYSEAILACCLKDLSSDWQSEGSRGVYLYSAICETDSKAKIEDEIINKFLTKCDDTLLFQLIDILVCYAVDGSAKAYAALHAKYNYFRDKQGEFIWGRIDEALQWLMLAVGMLKIDGMEIFKRFIMDVGELVEANKQCRCIVFFDELLEAARHAFGTRSVNAYFNGLKSKSTTVKAIFDAIKEDEDLRASYRNDYLNEKVTIDELVLAATKIANTNPEHDDAFMRLRLPFIKRASQEELFELAKIATRQENDIVKGLLLRVFANTRFPLGIEQLLEYARSDERVLSESAMLLLAEFKNMRIHDLAIETLRVNGLSSVAMSLLVKNYKQADDVLLAELVKDAHNLPQSVMQDIQSIYCKHRSCTALPILMYAFRKGKSPAYRYGVILAMRNCRVLSNEILEECIYDSYPATRRLAKRISERRFF